jgi:hypothetical protein
LRRHCRARVVLVVRFFNDENESLPFSSLSWFGGGCYGTGPLNQDKTIISVTRSDVDLVICVSNSQ